MILAPDDLVRLTGRVRSGAQARQLSAWGLPFKRRTDGSIVVLEADVVSSPQPKKEPKLRFPK